MHSNGHMKTIFTFFSSLTLRKEEQTWSRPRSSPGTKLRTFYNNKWQVMGEVQDTTLIQASTHIGLNT